VDKTGLSIYITVSEYPAMENSLQKMLFSPYFPSGKMWIPVALGFDMRGRMYFDDLAKFPHALYGGASHTGKTVGLQSLILSVAVKQPVNNVNLLIIDTGATDLDLFQPLPHLSHGIVKDAETAARVMSALVHEMEARIALPAEELRLLPAVICVVDEFLSLIQNDSARKKKLVSAFSSLLQRGRHAKIHLVLATQDPSKRDMQISLGNLGARIAFRCADFYGSKAILGEKGAEKLPGNGAMLFKSPGRQSPVCLQGANVSAKEIEQLIARVASANHDFSRKFAIPEIDTEQPLGLDTASMPASICGSLCGEPSEVDREESELGGIILWALGQDDISSRKIQQKFRMGNRANAIVEKLFQMNLVTGKFANKPRVVIPKSVDGLSDDVMGLLSKNRISFGDIVSAFQGRS
jgi:S-DNA-T family DNA segregation ATPase FtsK/SpoIIIE